MTRYFFICITLLSFSVKGQKLTGKQLLNKAIEYHDPYNNWDRFKGQLYITMQTPNNGERHSKISIDLPNTYFSSVVTKEKNTITSRIEKGDCSFTLNGSSNIPQNKKDSLRINCSRTKMMKDYYTYLYGLPMKLKDPGTIIDPIVVSKSFKGKEYLVLKVTYDKEVGEDIWYFYFDPKTYAMEVYQFFHDESKNDGEYILLTEEKEILDIKMPKNRAWYYNKDDKYLGTDILTKTEELHRN